MKDVKVGDKVRLTVEGTHWFGRYGMTTDTTGVVAEPPSVPDGEFGVEFVGTTRNRFSDDMPWYVMPDEIEVIDD